MLPVLCLRCNGKYATLFSLALVEVTFSIIARIGFKSPTSHVKYLMHACWSRCFRSLSPVQTDATLSDVECFVRLICTPRCMLLRVVAQSLEPVTLLATRTYKRTQQLPTMLGVVASGCTWGFRMRFVTCK